MPDLACLAWFVPRRSSLRREIAAALLFKIVLLWALWFLAFRGHDGNRNLNAADLFSPPPVATESVQSFTTPSEVSHDLR